MRVKKIPIDTSCPFCQGEMVKAQPQGTVFPLTLVQHPVRNFTNKKGSKLMAYVCTKCGYVKWYVEKPYIFKPTIKDED